jgi:hypothetical protein
MANPPRRKRTSGADPPRARNSRNSRAARRDPSTKAGISGRRYWTTPARCRPRAPATSRSKQATQTPMFGGLPIRWSTTAIRPITAPARTIPHREAKKRVRRSLTRDPPFLGRTRLAGREEARQGAFATRAGGTDGGRHLAPGPAPQVCRRSGRFMRLRIHDGTASVPFVPLPPRPVQRASPGALAAGSTHHGPQPLNRRGGSDTPGSTPARPPSRARRVAPLRRDTARHRRPWPRARAPGCPDRSGSTRR